MAGHTWVWHKMLPLKVSVSMWKAWYNALSVDDRLCRIGVPIVSRCDYCNQGNYEDQNHVLFQGNFANRVWRYCGANFGLPVGGNWKETVEAWFRRANSSTQVGILVGLLPSFLSWHLWRRGCVARMEGRLESFRVVWQSIQTLD